MTATAQRFEELNPNVRISWNKRSLQAFADEPIDELAIRYDLLVIDHPWAGFAAQTGVIVPLNEWLPEAFLADLAENSVERSHKSYSYDGKQVALAIDAATPVASARMDILEELGLGIPQTWEELMHLAKLGKVAVPSIPQDTLMNFYMLCSTLGEDVCVSEDRVVSDEIGVKSLKLLRELSINLNRNCFDWNPIKVYEAITQTDEFAYCPFAYGYTNYSKPNYARKLLRFADTVTLPGTDRLCTTLGGTGLAISASSKHKEVAAKYAEFVANPIMQQTFYIEFGGQPGHRDAWTSEYANENTNNYFNDTLPTLDRAYLRPRYHGHMFFQDNSGSPIREYLMNGGDEQALLNKLNALYVESKGIPPGVINLVSGKGIDVSSQLVTSLVSLTGSTPAGQAIYKSSSQNVSGLVLELGGKTSFIVLKDADIDKAVEAAVISRYANCGLVCICNELVLVEDEVAEEFTQKLLKRVKEITYGDPMSDVNMGPSVTKVGLERINNLVQDSVAQGATLALGGKRPDGVEFEKGHWYEPTVLTGVTMDMPVAKEEIFGPVMPIVTVSSYEEALALTNSRDDGLSSYLYTQDISKIMHAISNMQVGTIFVNKQIVGYIQGYHSGHKQSGTGGEDGVYGIENYLQKRTVYLNYK